MCDESKIFCRCYSSVGVPTSQVFKGKEYVSPATLSKNVPMLVCGGVGKKYMVPGWRLGWILIHDRNGAFKAQVRIV